MQTVDKALKLLSFFTSIRPEIGLSDLARLAGYDKAATRRFLVALQKHGFIEQNPRDRKYRLGAAFLHYAQVREATQPLASIVTPLLDALTEATGETSHASHFTAGELITIGIHESRRATRVHMAPSERLPLHATGSGLVYLAYGPKERLKETVAAGLKAYTRHTVTVPGKLRKLLAEIRKAGHSVAAQTYEDEVIGIGVPFFDRSATAVGGLAVAAPASRMTGKLKALIVGQLQRAALTATAGIGGVPHPEFLAAVDDRQAA